MFFSEFDLEILKTKNPKWILGCDEVGRGCLAGPVVGAAAAIKVSEIPNSFLSDFGINDSKQLSAKKRARIIQEFNIRWDYKKDSSLVFENSFLKLSVSQTQASKIDEINIFQASKLSMANAVELVHKPDSYLLVDGKWGIDPYFKKDQEAVIKGDSKSKVIALASIIAKEFRDSYMKKLDLDYPEFQFGKNVGYPTAFHKDAIAKYGILPIHRKTFKGVKEYC